jgi:hypothetical protein
LNKTLSECKPLPQYNAQASVYSVYQDSSHETPIPVNSDGHFDNTVLTGAEDSTVKLEVTLGEDNYTEVETIASSDSINSSDATNAELKSCPEKIFVLPGEVVIFKVYSEPGINLKSAGLRFTLNNPSIGCITQPVYLCLFGSHKYQVAYGCMYVKKGLNTPVDTTITATTNTGLTLNIFTEVIKKTCSISGTVYTGGMPLVKAKIKSLGPKACSKADENGNYTLQKVFLGHYRTVICTYWTTENGQKLRHREERLIDFLNGDVTGFNFGVPPRPTPTLTPSATPTPHEPGDPFYHEIVGNVTLQIEQWKAELGTEEAIDKTLAWLNGELSSPPIPAYISKAERDRNNSYAIRLWFIDGRTVRIRVSYDLMSEDPNNTISRVSKYIITNKIVGSNSFIESSEAITTRSCDVLILSPCMWQFQEGGANPDNPRSVVGGIASELENAGYKVKKVITRKECISRGVVHYPTLLWDPDPDGASKRWGFVEMMNIDNFDNCIMPFDLYSDLSTYGVIYINAHGDTDSLNFGPLFQNNYSMRNWMKHYSSLEYNPDKVSWRDKVWEVSYEPTKYKWLGLADTYTPYLRLGPGYFKMLNLDNTILYVDACFSYEVFADVAVNNTYGFIGYSGSTLGSRATLQSYLFFHYMMYGYDIKPQISEPRTIDITKDEDNNYYRDLSFETVKSDQQTPPMNIKQTWDKLENLDGLNFVIDKNTYLPENNVTSAVYENRLTQISGNNIYFPVPVTVTVHKK